MTPRPGATCWGGLAPLGPQVLRVEGDDVSWHFSAPFSDFNGGVAVDWAGGSDWIFTTSRGFTGVLNEGLTWDVPNKVWRCVMHWGCGGLSVTDWDVVVRPRSIMSVGPARNFVDEQLPFSSALRRWSREHVWPPGAKLLSSAKSTGWYQPHVRGGVLKLGASGAPRQAGQSCWYEFGL